MTQSSKVTEWFGGVITNRLNVKDFLGINDLTDIDKYIIGVSELTGDRIALLPPLATDDTFVFEDSVQSFMNKTIDDPSNTVTADKLRTTTGTVTVSTAVAPSAGQILTATSSTSANWQTGSGGITDMKTYQLVGAELSANTVGFSTVAYFPWLNSRYSSYMNGTVVFRTTIGNRNLDIKLRDVTNGSDLGSSTGISSSNSYSFSVTNPTSNAQVELQVKKSAPGGVNPRLFGVVLEYT